MTGTISTPARRAGPRGAAALGLGLGRRTLGATLILLVAFPWYRLLLFRETGSAGVATYEYASVHADIIVAGLPVVLIVAVLLSRLLAPRSIDRAIERIGGLLTRPRPVPFALVLAALTWTITACVTVYILDGKPNLIDAMSQLVQARYFAAGRLAGPASRFTGFWQIQASMHTPDGWVSQYPPGHAAMLALGFRLGAVWAVGATLAAATTFFTTLLAERLLPRDRAVARLGAMLVALNPFLIGLASAYMNHITAAAFAALALYCAVRARDGAGAWALGTGAGTGMVFATRPLAGLIIAGLAGAVLVGRALAGRESTGHGLARVAAAVVGGLPFLAVIMAYNRHFFDSPFRFAYAAAYSPAVGLGFHRDPWGNLYGPVEALLYTSTDLLALSVNLLETPLPVVVVVGAFLLLRRRLGEGERIIAAWALLPVAANAFYWHHGLFMGPRMLNEAAPAWALLTAIATVGLVRSVPGDVVWFGGRIRPRTALAAAFIAALALGWLYLAPTRLLSYGRDFMASSRIEPPRPPDSSLVFVHGGWTARIGMPLAAAGMPLDSIETALRQNPTCRVREFAIAYVARRRGDTSRTPPELDFAPRAAGFPPVVEVSPGNRIRRFEGERLTPGCEREIHADRNGIISIAPFLWRADLPGLPMRGALFVRDLGPEANAELIAAHPDRRPLVLYTPDPEAAPVLEAYDAGMAAIWRDGGRQGDGR